jgi:hypothetical protein
MKFAFALVRWTLLIGAALFVAGIWPFASMPARGQVDGVAGTLTITASPIANLTDGSVVKVHADVKDMALYSLTAHVCMAGTVKGDHMFAFSGDYCPNVAIGSGDVEKQVVLPGAASGDLSFKVGTGHVDWHNTLGFPYSLDCGPGAPCDLVIKAEITNSTAYYQIPLCFGTGCPAAAPVPAGQTAQQVTTPPPPTTEPPTTTAPPATVAPPEASASGAAKGAAIGAGTKSGGTGTGGGSSQSSNTGDLESAQSASALSVPADASSRGVRVFVAALAGALCGARIVQVITRERRKHTGRLRTA